VQPLTTRQLNRACHAAAQMAELEKPVSLHTLRHNAESRIMPSTLNMVLARTVFIQGHSA
jgi:integrase/recombinase XerD